MARFEDVHDTHDHTGIPGVGGGGGGGSLSQTHVTRSTSQNVAGSGTPTAISYDAEVVDDDGCWAIGSPTKLIIPSALNGRWAVLWAEAIFSDSTAGNYRHLQIFRAGDSLQVGSVLVGDLATAIGPNLQVFTRPLLLATGQEYECFMRMDATGIGILATTRNGFGLYTVD